ncbi:MAG: fumarylacetoacetate hydrolase family protein, partial [Candidatus Omnitrophica bacterium]|nr:fumarylacetoacetate hydrolase family protein [Candidatus Omnitrophota bacterium]
IPSEPVIFLKPLSALIKSGDKIIYPDQVKRLDYEAELAVVVKKAGKNISEKEAKDYILGYSCLNDVTARDLQKKDGQWARAKSFDTFCPLGPCIETELNPDGIKIQSYLNGNLKQDSNTSNFIFPVDFLVSFVSRIMTLKPGDIISTGTPAGIGPMQKGDSVKIAIEGIGSLENQVV